MSEGLIHIKDMPKLKIAIDLYKSIHDSPATLPILDNWWFHGPPGTGKSHTARELYSTHFTKDFDRWWDAYIGQPTVILDDLDK